MKETRKSRAFNAPYESTRQLVLSGFETPFERELDKRNRWVVLSHLIPWDEICEIYLRKVPMSSTDNLTRLYSDAHQTPLALRRVTLPPCVPRRSCPAHLNPSTLRRVKALPYASRKG